MRRNRFRGRRGSVVVEAALTLGAVLFLIIGTLDIGRILFMHQTLTERAGNAVRWAAAHEYNETSIKTSFCIAPRLLLTALSPCSVSRPAT